jgi:hypothetical protein
VLNWRFLQIGIDMWIKRQLTAGLTQTAQGTMTTDRYRLSFTTGGLFLQEAPLVAERYLAVRDWSRTRDQVRNDNLLQVRKAATALRISKELVVRLELDDGVKANYLKLGPALRRIVGLDAADE